MSLHFSIEGFSIRHGRGTLRDRVLRPIEVASNQCAQLVRRQTNIEPGAALWNSAGCLSQNCPPRPWYATPYSSDLTSNFGSFTAICDGLRTIALVEDGRYGELVDLQEWAQPFSEMEAPGAHRAR